MQSQSRSKPVVEEFASDWETLGAEWARARRRSDDIFKLIPAQSLLERPISERHRLAFYLGHLEAFDINLLLHGGDSQSGSSLDRLFAFGIDPVDGDLPQDRPEDWPVPEAIRDYARRARGQVDAWFAEARHDSDGAGRITRLHAAIEHRWMHAETLAYLLNQLSLPRPIRAPAKGLHRAPSPRLPDSVRIPAGTVQLGQRQGQGWDNEFFAHRVDVPAFRIDRRMVSNARFLDFVEAGGYREPRFWTEADRRWRDANGIQHPAAWVRKGEEWLLLSRAELIPFQEDWPVYVSHAEAAAYARWAGQQLPSEAQWQRAAYGDTDARYPWGDAPPDRGRGNFDFERWDPLPVDAHPAGASAYGVEGLLGNGWEWTRTPFAPFVGFQAATFYPGYSARFFDGRHFVLKGGSAHTARSLLRPSFRNWFQPHYPYVFAGFRCVSEP